MHEVLNPQGIVCTSYFSNATLFVLLAFQIINQGKGQDARESEHDTTFETS